MNSQIELTSSTSNHSTLDAKLDKLADMFLEFQRKSLESSEKHESNFNRMLTSVDTILTKNIALENRVNELTLRLEAMEEKLKSTSDSTSPQNNPINNLSQPLDTIDRVEVTSNQPSWATIAKSTPTERPQLAITKAKLSIARPDRIEGINALSSLASQRLPPKRRPASGETSAVYFGGFEFQKLRNIWSALKKAKFQASRIVSIQWIGRTVLEFIVDTVYEEQFVAELTSSNNSKFKLLDFDPTKNKQSTSPEQSESVYRAFSMRCVKNILYSENTVLKNHFESLAHTACTENPQLKSIFDVEYQRCKEELQKEIEEIIYDAVEIGADEHPEYGQKMRRLALVHPEHTLVTEYLRKKATADSEPSEALAVSTY